MPRQPRNLHFVATWHSSDNAIRKSTQHTTRLKCAAPATQNDDGHVQSAAPATKTVNASSENIPVWGSSLKLAGWSQFFELDFSQI